MSTAAPKSRLREACALYETLKAEWDRPARDRSLDRCQQMLSNLKILLTELSFIPTSGDATDQECLLARSVLEIACFVAIETSDLAAFERHMAELKMYYLDLGGALTESPYCQQLLGLDLLCLLAQNRLADFHAALELLPRTMLQSPYIRHPIQMEQFLMEGSYNKIFLARDNVPAPNYAFFMNKLIGTVRGEIASCLEKAYDQLTITDAGRLLFISSVVESKEFISKLGWSVDNATGAIIFGKPTGSRPQTGSSVKSTDSVSTNGNSNAEFSSEAMAKSFLGYARSLETIV